VRTEPQMFYRLDENREPVAVENFETFAMWFAQTDRTVALTEVGDVEVSTVFIGIDMNGDRSRLFETAITGGRLDGARRSYPTWADAEAGHAEIVDHLEHPAGSR
jgi:hypothetical protein